MTEVNIPQNMAFRQLNDMDNIQQNDERIDEEWAKIKIRIQGVILPIDIEMNISDLRRAFMGRNRQENFDILRNHWNVEENLDDIDHRDE